MKNISFSNLKKNLKTTPENKKIIPKPMIQFNGLHTMDNLKKKKDKVEES